MESGERQNEVQVRHLYLGARTRVIQRGRSMLRPYGKEPRDEGNGAGAVREKQVCAFR